jgi:hypothetical protein
MLSRSIVVLVMLAALGALTAGFSLTTASALADEGCANEALRRAQGSTKLADCRAYEMVSPPSKNGQDVIPHSPGTFASVDGNGVAFLGLGVFADAKEASANVQYVARRTGVSGTNGWSTDAVNPPGKALSFLALYFGNLPTFYAFTPDLTGGVYMSWKSLTDAPNTDGVSNLYRLRDLEASRPQTELLSASAQALNPTPTSESVGFLFKNAFDGASKDFSHVIFQSPWNLTGDGSFSEKGDLYESVEDAGVRRVGRVPAGSATECDDSVAGSGCVDAPPVQAGISVSTLYGGSSYASGMISDDGSRILFQGPAGAPSGPIYMREDGTRTYQINASERTTPESPASAQLWGMSADGSRVFFTTGEGLVNADTDGGSSDLYMYDVTKPAGSRLTLLSTDNTGDPVISVTSVVGASADGHYVYFVAAGQLVAGEPSNVTQGLYVWHDGEIKYIGQFGHSNAAARNTFIPLAGWEFDDGKKTSRVTPDGRHLLFMSPYDEGFRGQGGYGGYDHGACGSFPCDELYLYSADTGSLACVSCNPRAGVATAGATTDISPSVSVSYPTQHLSNALSDDGQHVFFSTPEALVAGDSNGKWDAYEYDTSDGSVHLISSGTSSTDSYFMDAGSDGQNVFFVTRSRLVGWDVDDNYDLYDARIGGGFPEPPPPPPPPCSGEACHGASSGVPEFAGPGSFSFAGSGDLSSSVVKPLSRAQKLSRALRACKREKRARREQCQSRARKRYAKKASNRASRGV